MKNKLKDLFLEINQIKDNGDLVFIKFDGERECNKITIIIDFNKKRGNNEQIRLNGEDLEDLISRAIDLYKSKL